MNERQDEPRVRRGHGSSTEAPRKLHGWSASDRLSSGEKLPRTTPRFSAFRPDHEVGEVLSHAVVVVPKLGSRLVWTIEERKKRKERK